MSKQTFRRTAAGDRVLGDAPWQRNCTAADVAMLKLLPSSDENPISFREAVTRLRRDDGTRVQGATLALDRIVELGFAEIGMC